MAAGKALAILLLPILGAQTQSLTNCGGAKDHLSNVKVSVSPDPPKKGTPFSINVAGDLDQDETAGTIVVDLAIKLLGVISENVNDTIPFTYTPGLAKGPVSATIGPLTVPRLLPGKVGLQGQVRITNAKSEPIICVAMDVAITETALEQELEQEPVSSSSTNCGNSSDHMKNLNWRDTAGGVTVITGTLDESVSQVTVNVALKVHASIIPIPVNLKIPASVTPAVPKGDMNITIGPTTNRSATLSLITTTGTVKIDDANNQEVACIDVADSEALEQSGTLVI